MGAIFISYRREDSEGHAGRLFEDLVERFGPDSVFMDVAGIEPGRDFRKVIDSNVSSCSVLLAVIGKRWLDAKDDAGSRRIDDPADFVRLETASALKRDIPVVPVLVQGATMPRADKLPKELAELAFRNAVELTHARWTSDVEVLAKALRTYMPDARPNGMPAAMAESRPAAISAAAAMTAAPPTSSGPSLPVKSIAAALVLVTLGVGGYLAYQNGDEADQVRRLVAEKTEAGRIAVEDERKPQVEQLTRQSAADEFAANEKAREAERARLEDERAKAADAARLADEERKKAEAALAADEERRKLTAERRAKDEKATNAEPSAPSSGTPTSTHPSDQPATGEAPATTITFTNNGDRALNVFWIDAEGKEQRYFALAPGQSYDQPTYVSHRWIIRDSDTRRQVATAVGSSTPSVVQIGGPRRTESDEERRKAEEAKRLAAPGFGTDGRRVKRVAFKDRSSGIAGYFRVAGPGVWVETGPTGNDPKFRFQETGRDDWSVYLVDRSRNVTIQLDLFRRMVLYQDSRLTERTPLYEIGGAN